MNDRIVGKTIEIPIVDMISIEKEEISTTGTLSGVLGGVILFLLLRNAVRTNMHW